MPAFTKWAKANALVFLSACILITGCARQADVHNFELSHVDANWSNGELSATVQQELKLSSEARDALVHGVPLTLQLELVFRNTSSRAPIINNLSSYEIRYLPLSNHYQLTLPGGYEVRTFPRLRHLLAELSSISLSLKTGELKRGKHELMARTRLDQQKMPPPMRLPMLFSAEWNHDSDWTTWPVKVPAKVYSGV
jgi:hypothetical protein